MTDHKRDPKVAVLAGPADGGSAGLSRGMLLLLAVACGVAVGNVYFPQALTPLIAAAFQVHAGTAALAVTAVQLGYTAGIFLLVPLADRVPHRTMIVTLFGLCSLSLAAAGCAPALLSLLAASTVVGMTTIAAQVIATLAAQLAADRRRGQVLGILLSGSIGGLLAARGWGGILGQHLGWRAPYLAAAALSLLLAIILRATLPATSPGPAQPYRVLLAGSLRLLRAEPGLRRSACYQAAVFGGFCAAWACLPLLLTSAQYGLGTQAVGAFGLVAAASMVCSPLAGRLVDRYGPDRVTTVCLIAVAAAAAILSGAAPGGHAGLAALAVGMLVLDTAMQSGMVANQVRVFAAPAAAHGRLNTAYMTCAYLGGSVGSWTGALTYARFGWPGVCGYLACLAAAAMSLHIRALTVSRTPRLRPPPAGPRRPGGTGRPGVPSAGGRVGRYPPARGGRGRLAG